MYRERRWIWTWPLGILVLAWGTIRFTKKAIYMDTDLLKLRRQIGIRYREVSCFTFETFNLIIR